MSVRVLLCFLFAFAYRLTAVSQSKSEEDSVIYIDEITVTGERLNDFAVGSLVQKFDEEKIERYRANSMADFLRSQSGVIINTYGVGGLASPSIRGGGSSHTPVIWNGLNLQNPMNGGLNLSAIPLIFFDSPKVQYGGAGTLFGSGVMTGAIHLDNHDLREASPFISGTAGAGSFGNRYLAAKAKFGRRKLHSSLGVMGQTVDNDFAFKNTAKFGDPEETQTNAGYKQWGLLQENLLVTGERSSLKTSLWLQHFDKDLQTLMIDSRPGRANQEDNNLNASLLWQRNTEKLGTTFRSGFLYSEVLYRNPNSSEPQSNHYTYSYINELENRIAIADNHSLNVGINYTAEKANSDGYARSFLRNRLAFFGNYRTEALASRLISVISIREEVVDGQTNPLVYSLGLNYKLGGATWLRGNVAKNYRIPTLNDLYWRTTVYASGNPNLVPESGWNFEAGLKKDFKSGPLSMVISPNFFYTEINDWILWLPDESGVWKPENKKRGETYGAEFSFETHWESGNIHVKSGGFYNYTHSTTEEYLPSGAEQEARTRYVPEHQVKANAAVKYKNAELSYIHSYVGERLYDNAHFLDPYDIGTLKITYSTELFNSFLQGSFTVDNIWNESYQVQAWYAMPGRSYMITLFYQLNLKK